MLRTISLAALVLVSPLTIAAAQPPNIVLIIGDDQAWTDFGFMGHPIIRTPHLDRLAAEGIVFSHGYVPSSLCRPSLATLATGLYPHQHGITGNDPVSRRDQPAAYLERNARWIERFKSVPNLAGLLGDAGYVSFQAGKWWEGPCRCGDFTAGMTHGDPERGGRHGDDGLRIGRETMQPVYDFIDGAGDTPFFLWYAPFLPHTPHNPPERLLRHYRLLDRHEAIAKYYAMCEWLDETVGQLLAYLDDRGELDDTFIVYVTDNGWIQPIEGQPGWRTPFGAPKGKRSPYDGGIRTPIIFHHPKSIRAARMDTPVSSVDIPYTLLKIAGIKPPRDWPGIDLRNRDAVASRPAMFGAIFTHDAVDITRPVTSLQYRWCVTGGWKLIAPWQPNMPGAEPELYALATDPAETQNLATSQPEYADILVTHLENWWNPAQN